ncbi:MAG: DUF4136 domain-containing protein [Rhodoferax sp.]|uniref:DUF4136 domain-containing protein n=1 Tax=Rhodoferax sp. TaxID=50421 RepID=UPI0008C48AA1|nr:DUF4136 domain-containing protein [Rhodoferax sp.]MDP2678833.1 DUF4136 domain-containing protein [Rhodoferax sp.]OGB53032.1 MAG: hypothetical protein A2503_02755 [Burkholderiales bacterium RIFOXYD12_FULL_59_19]OGB86764.1 MAG: hypothetical protein A2535_05115 [Burkholderiales bacterium RIFOXYD2_FULL_59_8]
MSIVKTARAALLIGVFLLSGCASVRLVDTQVSSFAPQVIAAGANYQFERLPSQLADPVNQTKLEKLAEQALAKVGLKRQNNAPLRVQVSAVQRQENSLNQSGVGIGWGLGWVMGHGELSVGSSGAMFPWMAVQTTYWRQVSLIMRNASGAVVFESHASHEGVWPDSEVVLAAMLDAALQGFPTPPAGVRRVNIEIPN